MYGIDPSLISTFGHSRSLSIPLFIFTLVTGRTEVFFKIKMCTAFKEDVVAVRTICSVCESLDSILDKTLGPNGNSTLLNTPTGQVLITSVGSTILRCMDVGHPLAAMIIKSISVHHHYTGDGSKTFLLYLARFFSSIANSAEERSSIYGLEQRNSLVRAVHYIRSHLFNNVLLPVVQRNCCVTDVLENKNATMATMHNLVESHLAGKYTEAIRSHLSHLLVDFVCSGLMDFGTLSSEIIGCIDNFDLLCIDVDCMPPLSSYICERIVIQREFLNLHHFPMEHCETRFVLMHSSFTKGKCEVTSTFEANDTSSLHNALSWKSWYSTAFVDWMHRHSVNLLLSSGHIDDVLQTLCSKAGISMVQFVDDEDFKRLQVLFHVTVIEFVSDLSEDEADKFIGCSDVCEAKVFGQKRFVCLKFPDRDRTCTEQSGSPTQHEHSARNLCACQECLKRQLVICGMSAGACQQIRLDLLNALKTLRLWFDSKWLSAEASHHSAVHIAGGGSFELICYESVQDFVKQKALELDVHVTVCCEAVSAALLAVPLRLLHNSFQPKLATVLYIKENIKSSQASGANLRGFSGCSGHQLRDDTTIIEPFMSKILLLDHVLELTEQLLRISSVLRVNKLVQKSFSEEEIE